MPLSIAAAVLLAALLHACWNAIVRVREDRLAVVTLLAGSAALVALPAAIVVPPPAPAAWPWLATSVALHLGYNVFLATAYNHGDLGRIYPLARGTAPVLTLVGTAVLVDESPGPVAIVGVLVVALGIVLLAFERGILALVAAPRGVGFALTTALFIAGYSVVDGIGARASDSPHGYAVWLFVLDGIPLLVYALAVRGHKVTAMFAGNWSAALVGGVLSLAAYWIVIWAMTRAPIALVAATRETSVVFAVMIGTLVLGERLTAVRLASAALVVCGLFLLRA